MAEPSAAPLPPPRDRHSDGELGRGAGKLERNKKSWIRVDVILRVRAAAGRSTSGVVRRRKLK